MICIQKIDKYLGKTSNCQLSNLQKWKVLKMIVEPGVLYPLMAALYSLEDLEIIIRRFSAAYCHALGINIHLPRAVLYGPADMGGLEIPNLHTLLLVIWLTCFPYHTRLQTQVGKKLEISITLLQLEVGLVSSVLQAPFTRYKHLGTPSLVRCQWGETEPNNILIKGHHSAERTPELQGPYNVEIMEVATQFFNSTESIQINCCRLYLKVITIYDLYTYSGKEIHPDLKSGCKTCSRKSAIKWMKRTRPPKH